MPDMSTDVAIVGGGIVGLATAYQLLRRFREPASLCWRRKTGSPPPVEPQLRRPAYRDLLPARFAPGAELLRAGKLAMQAFCDQEGFPTGSAAR